MSRETEMAREARASEEAQARRAAREATSSLSAHRAIGCRAEPDVVDAFRAGGEALREFPPILLAVPCVDWMWSESASAITLLSHMLPPGSRLQYMPQSLSSISYKRTMIARTLLALPECEYVLTVDSDMDPPPNAALRLLSHRLDVVAALYCQRQRPYGLSAMLLPGSAPPTPEERLRPIVVAGVGFGCVLVHRRVFETVPAPWFHDDPGTPGLNEDYNFCHRARASGFQVHLDCQLECGHIGATSLTPEFSRIWRATPEGQWALADSKTRNTPEAFAASERERAAALAREAAAAVASPRVTAAM